MKINSNDMLNAGDREEVGEHPGSDGASMGFFLGLARVGEVAWKFSLLIPKRVVRTHGITARSCQQVRATKSVDD